MPWERKSAPEKAEDQYSDRLKGIEKLHDILRDAARVCFERLDLTESQSAQPAAAALAKVSGTIFSEPRRVTEIHGEVATSGRWRRPKRFRYDL